MLGLGRANLEKGRDEEYAKWILKHIDEYRRLCASHGWYLKGVYRSGFGIGEYDVTWVWEFRKYADIDAFYNIKDPKLDKLMEEEMDFYLPGTSDTIILKEIKAWNPPTGAKQKKSKR